MRKSLCLQGFFDFAYRFFHRFGTATRPDTNGTGRTRFLRLLIAHCRLFRTPTRKRPVGRSSGSGRTPISTKRQPSSRKRPGRTQTVVRPVPVARCARWRMFSWAILGVLRRTPVVRRPVAVPVPCGRSSEPRHSTDSFRSVPFLSFSVPYPKQGPRLSG